MVFSLLIILGFTVLSSNTARATGKELTLDIPLDRKQYLNDRKNILSILNLLSHCHTSFP